MPLLSVFHDLGRYGFDAPKRPESLQQAWLDKNALHRKPYFYALFVPSSSTVTPYAKVPNALAQSLKILIDRPRQLLKQHNIQLISYGLEKGYL